MSTLGAESTVMRLTARTAFCCRGHLYLLPPSSTSPADGGKGSSLLPHGRVHQHSAGPTSSQHASKLFMQASRSPKAHPW